MDASQLKIDPKHLRFKPMTNKERLRLKRENIKALIKAKPAGTVLTMTDFAAVTATTPANINVIIKTMLKHGEILKIQSESHGQRYSWVVNDKLPETTKPNTKKTGLRYDITTLKQMAKTYAWDNDSDSLRGFIKTLEGTEKNEQ